MLIQNLLISSLYDREEEQKWPNTTRNIFMNIRNTTAMSMTDTSTVNTAAADMSITTNMTDMSTANTAAADMSITTNMTDMSTANTAAADMNITMNTTIMSMVLSPLRLPALSMF